MCGRRSRRGKSTLIQLTALSLLMRYKYITSSKYSNRGLRDDWSETIWHTSIIQKQKENNTWKCDHTCILRLTQQTEVGSTQGDDAFDIVQVDNLQKWENKKCKHKSVHVMWDYTESRTFRTTSAIWPDQKLMSHPKMLGITVWHSPSSVGAQPEGRGMECCLPLGKGFS